MNEGDVFWLSALRHTMIFGGLLFLTVFRKLDLRV